MFLCVGGQGWREGRLLLCSECGLPYTSSSSHMLMLPGKSQVQSGGSFDVDWVVTDPKDTIVIEGERDRQGDYIFTAQLTGEYSFCFRWVSFSFNAFQ